MKCKNCNDQIINGAKFCGKCGFKVEQDLLSEKNDFNEKEDQNELITSVKSVGVFFKIFGYIKIIFSVIMVFLISNSEVSEFIPLGYTDIAITIIIGVLWVILGGRIAKNIDKNSKKYLRVIFWILIIQFIISFFINISTNTANGTQYTPSIISVLFAIYVNKGVKKLKLINLNN